MTRKKLRSLLCPYIENAKCFPLIFFSPYTTINGEKFWVAQRDSVSASLRLSHTEFINICNRCNLIPLKMVESSKGKFQRDSDGRIEKVLEQPMSIKEFLIQCALGSLPGQDSIKPTYNYDFKVCWKIKVFSFVWFNNLIKWSLVNYIKWIITIILLQTKNQKKA